LSNIVSPKSLIYRPLPVLLVSLAGAALYVLYATLRFSGDKLSGQYIYVVPIVFPFVAFLFDRAERFGQTSIIRLTLDVLVVGMAMWRVVGNVPFISGHALFLTYALLSTKTRVARITSALVILEVIYMKYLFWHDWITPTSGIVLGTIAALIRRRFREAEIEARPAATT
jgi:hypothetical protein